MKGKITVNEEEVKKLIGDEVLSKLHSKLQITNISARTSYCMDIEVEFSDEEDKEGEDGRS